MKLKVYRLSPEAHLPQYSHPDDSGMDLIATQDIELPPGDSRLVPTGIAIELPPQTEAQVRPRSGLALKHQITVLNSPGTVDEGYRGEISVILINHGKTSFQITSGMRIAQLVIAPVLRLEIEEASDLSETQRGVGGFGSTGLKTV